MKKTYFMKTFNLILNLILLSLLDFIIATFLHFINQNLVKSNVQGLSKLTDYLSSISHFVLEFGITLATLVIILISIELVTRSHSDAPLNYFKAVKQTFGLRHFMRQSESPEKNEEGQKVTSYNPINDKFNRSVHKCYVDIRNDEILVFIKVPRTQQTQKILKELESQIKEEVSSQNPEYIFSNFERSHHQLWLQGTKR